jgi:alpha-amylase/alpha-mannosidase (GH57 family)
VHGHFYQPPRENPWLDAIDLQPSAAPYHDWNARITAECYAPNTAARILDAQGRIQHIINNYAWMSFNVGPTLMRWFARSQAGGLRRYFGGRQRAKPALVDMDRLSDKPMVTLSCHWLPLVTAAPR